MLFLYALLGETYAKQQAVEADSVSKDRQVRTAIGVLQALKSGQATLAQLDVDDNGFRLKESEGE